MSVAFMYIGGRGRAGAGRRGKTVLLFYIVIYIGGRDRAGAGRRGKTVLLFYMFIHNGGRGRARAGRRGRRCYCFTYLYTYMEEGAGREPVGGEDGEFHASCVNCICI